MSCVFLHEAGKVFHFHRCRFLLNEVTDVLLKKYFDRYRISPKTLPFLAEKGCEHLIPFQHENFDLDQSMHHGAKGRMHTVVEDLNQKLAAAE